jgi:uncharacterized protein
VLFWKVNIIGICIFYTETTNAHRCRAISSDQSQEDYRINMKKMDCSKILSCCQKKELFLIVVAFFVALFSAGIGIGGGAILIPAFLSVFNFDYKQAAGLSLATIIPIAFTGAVYHFIMLPNPPSLNIFLFFVPMCVIGAISGSLYLNQWNSDWLKLLFTLFLFIVGLRILKLVDFPFLLFTPLTDFVWAHESFFIMSFGFIIGLIAAWLGVGCGLFIVPFFVLVMDFTIHQAICLSLTTIFFLSVAATLTRHRLTELDVSSYKFLFLSALSGALAGSAIFGILPADLLKKVFGLVLLLIACIYCYQMVSQVIRFLFSKNVMEK